MCFVNGEQYDALARFFFQVSYNGFDCVLVFCFREKPHPKPLIAGSRKPEVSVENLNVKGSHVPIKTSKR